MKTVRVTVSGGVVQHVEVPEGVTVIVRDYDVDGVEPYLHDQDKNGDGCVKAVWNCEETTDADV